jgi:hypothetical protein
MVRERGRFNTLRGQRGAMTLGYGGSPDLAKS